MPVIETVSRRLAHRYGGTYRLDQWEQVGKIKTLGGAKVYTPEEREAFHLRHQSNYGPGSYFSRRRNAWVYPHKRPLRKCERRTKLRDFYADASVGNCTVMRVVAYGFKGMTKDQICRAIEDEYTVRGCSCSHDCCGCASYSATVRHAGGSEFILKVRTSYNV